MSSSRIEHVFYHAHSKVSHYVLRHTSHRLRSAVEHAVLVLAVCSFVVVILSHRTFVHREDVASLPSSVLPGEEVDTCVGDKDGGGYGWLGFVEEARGISAYSLAVQLVTSGYARVASFGFGNKTTALWSLGKKIPGTCLRSIPGFREDADVNHILLRYDHENEMPNSRAFTIHRGSYEHEQIVSGMLLSNATQQTISCAIGPSHETSRQRNSLFGFASEQWQSHNMCAPDMTAFLHRHGYLMHPIKETLQSEQQQPQHSRIIYSYSHSQGLLRLQPSLQHVHNVSTQFIVASTTDPNCFGEPFAQSIIFRLVGPDTVILNWILGLQRAVARPRFVYHWNTKKELDLDVFDRDHYAFSGKSSGNSAIGAYGSIGSGAASTTINSVIARVHKNPLYRFLRFLMFKLAVLLSTLLIFVLATSLVSFTFQETQDRMLEFTLQLQTRVRARMPLGGLIIGHVLENLVFVPIMVGMIFFLIEFYGDDKFLAFSVLSMVWVCEVFSAISIRSVQGMWAFPRVFFLYFTLFHVYFFSCPIGFTYASLASTILFLMHTMLFFLNRYELPALHAGLVSPQSPRQSPQIARVGEDPRIGDGEAPRGAVVSPPRIQPASVHMPRLHHDHPPQIPEIPLISTSPDDRSNLTAPTAPLSSRSTDFTPQSEQQSLLLPPMQHGTMRSTAAASTSLLSIRSLASIQSNASSLAAERTTSPNFIFQTWPSETGPLGDGDGEEDSYIARVMST